MSPRNLLLTLIFCCLSAAPAFAGEPLTDAAQGVSAAQLSKLETLCYDHGLDEAEVAAYAEVLSAAAAINMPAAPLLKKTAEGLAKKVPGARIRGVLTAMVTDYARVRELARLAHQRWGLENFPPDASEIQALSECLNVGVTTDQLASFLEKAQARSLREAADSVCFMAAMDQAGLTRELAENVALTGLSTGFFEAANWDLVLAARAAKEAGHADAAIAQAARLAMGADGSVSEAFAELGVDPEDYAGGPTTLNGSGRSERSDFASPGFLPDLFHHLRSRDPNRGGDGNDGNSGGAADDAGDKVSPA